MAHNRPVRELRLGGVRAAIWENTGGPHGAWFSVSVSRLYKDGERWKESSSFRRDDLPVVGKLMEMAYAWIWDQESAPEAGRQTKIESVENSHGKAGA